LARTVKERAEAFKDSGVALSTGVHGLISAFGGSVPQGADEQTRMRHLWNSADGKQRNEITRLHHAYREAQTNMDDPTLADAILDRLVHNAHRLNMTGESMRRITGRRALGADQNP
jgi:hypothetical protein